MKTSQVLVSAQTANGATSSAIVDAAKMTLFTVHTTGTTTATIKFVAGFHNEAPDFSSPSTVDNDWHYVEVIDVNTGTPIDGSTGVATTATDINAAYQMNVDGAYHVGAIVSNMTAGSININVLTETSPSC